MITLGRFYFVFTNSNPDNLSYHQIFLTHLDDLHSIVILCLEQVKYAKHYDCYFVPWNLVYYLWFLEMDPLSISDWNQWSGPTKLISSEQTCSDIWWNKNTIKDTINKHQSIVNLTYMTIDGKLLFIINEWGVIL